MRLLSWKWSCSVLALSAGLPLGSEASAQSAMSLPEVTVQGATLEAKRATPPKAGPAQSPATEPSQQPSSDDLGGVPLDKIGSAVTVVTGEQLRAQQLRHAGDALRSLPGVAVNRSGGYGSKTQVRIRGAEGNHTLVLIDGIEANGTSDGEFDFADLLTEDIERIEVIRGPQSGLYGSKAIGGVINVITKGGKGPLTASARIEGGAYGTSDVAARVSGGNDKAWFAATVQESRSQYFNIARSGSEEDPARRTTLALKGGATVMPGMVLDFSVRNVSKFSHTDKDDVLPGGGPLQVAVDAPETADTNLFLGGVKLTWDTLGGAYTHVFRTSRSTFDQKTQTGFGPGDNFSELNKVGYLGTYRFATPGFMSAKHSLSGLVERELESFTPGPPGQFGPDGLERNRSRLATVGEYRGEFFDNLSITGAMRHDDNDRFRDYTTWRASASLMLKSVGLRPHASIGTGVALPGMFEQFGSVLGEFVGNPNLQPEESKGWDAGVEFTLLRNRAFLDLTYFRTNLTNEITGFGNSLVNLTGESKREGLEVALRTQLVPWLYAGASYTFLDASEPNGRPEVRRPRHAGRADLTYLFDKGRGTFNVAAIYNGRMQDDAFDAGFNRFRVTLDDYWLVTAAASYKLQKGVEVFGRVENILNDHYEETYGYNTPGMAAFAGLKFTMGGPEGFGAGWAK
jgi:vitamin B12 transporter